MTKEMDYERTQNNWYWSTGDDERRIMTKLIQETSSEDQDFSVASFVNHVTGPNVFKLAQSCKKNICSDQSVCGLVRGPA